MPTLTWPTAIRPSSMRWRLLSNTARFVSPFNGEVETQERPGARWMAELEFDRAWRRFEIAAFEAFLVQLRGSAGRFTMHNFARETPQGIATGAPLVVGAAATGTSLPTDGWTANEPGILLTGDYIGVNGELKMVVSDADSDALGAATLTIEPPLRSSPPDNAVITVTKPTTLFMLVDDEQTVFDYVKSQAGFSLSIMEAF